MDRCEDACLVREIAVLAFSKGGKGQASVVSRYKVAVYFKVFGLRSLVLTTLI